MSNENNNFIFDLRVTGRVHMNRPNVPNHCGSLWNEVAIVDLVLIGAMRNTFQLSVSGVYKSEEDHIPIMVGGRFLSVSFMHATK